MRRVIQNRQTGVMTIALAASAVASGPSAFAASYSPGVSVALVAKVAGSSQADSAFATNAERKPAELAFNGAKLEDRISAARQPSETGSIAGNARAQAPDAGCASPSEPWGVPAALDAAITGPADRDRACMKSLLIPNARITLVSVGTEGTAGYKLLTLDDWIVRTKARGHAILEEKQLNFRIDRFGNIAHLWSVYVLRSDGHAVARGINSIQAIKDAGSWRVTSIMVQAESATAPLPEEYLP